MRTKKPERREKTPVKLADIDMDTPTPRQQSAKAGPGTGGGRERARRAGASAKKVTGAKAKPKSRDTTMMQSSVEKKMNARLRSGGSAANLAAPEDAVRGKQPTRKGAKKQSRAAKAAKTNGAAKSNGAAKKAQPKRRAAASAEAAPTQKQVMKGKSPRKRTLRNTGVDAAQ